MNDVEETLRSANVQPVHELSDTQVRALSVVLAANVRYGLSQAAEALPWLGVAVAARYEFPVTLNLLNSVRLPALSVWRTSTVTLGRGARRESRRGSFGVRYWLDATPVDRLEIVWPALQAAYEIMVQTLAGHALVDFEIAGEPKTVPSTDLLKIAGFEFVHKETVRGAGDFAVDLSGETGMLYPVLEMTFDADHQPMFGGLPYPVLAVDPAFDELSFALWDGTPEGGRAVEDQPIVAGVSPREEE